MDEKLLPYRLSKLKPGDEIHTLGYNKPFKVKSILGDIITAGLKAGSFNVIVTINRLEMTAELTFDGEKNEITNLSEWIVDIPLLSSTAFEKKEEETRYLVFIYDCYSNGGLKDFKGKYRNYEEALAFAKDNVFTERDTAEILDIETNTVSEFTLLNGLVESELKVLNCLGVRV